MLIGKLRSQKEWLIILSLAVLAVLVWWQVLGEQPKDFQAVVLDVGQGDCIFLRTPSGKTVLVDGGGRSWSSEDVIGSRVTSPFLRYQAVNRIDLVVLSHPHDDHVQGLTSVLRDFRIGMVLDPAIPHGSEAYTQFLSLIEERRIPYKRAARGQVIDFGDGVQAEVLHPPMPRLSGTDEDTNNNSVVLRFTYGKSSLLLMGDAGIEAEEDMLSVPSVVRNDILKVGHHGSKSGTSSQWLDAVRPRTAIISVGRDNSFGHPARSVLSRLSSRKIKVYRTDRNGAVTINFSPNGFKITSTRD